MHPTRTMTAVQMQLADLEKKIQSIHTHVLRPIRPLEEIRFHEGSIAGAEQPDYDDQHWQSFTVGQTWGGHDQIGWFRIPVRAIPSTAEERQAILIQPGKKFIFKSSEGGDLREYELLVYWDGRPLQSIDVRRNLIPIHDLAEPGKTHLLALEAFSGLEAHRHIFAQADLVAVHQASEDLYYDAKNLFDTLTAVGEGHDDYARLLKILHQALLKVDFLQPGTKAFFRSIEAANTFLHHALGERTPRLPTAPRVLCLGHAHLDLAWKWRVRHSIKKAARTCANALRLMELYPEYRYVQSQAQLYQWIQNDYPWLFARIKERIAEGRWEASGGMWVESDCNIPNGESLLRQFLYGKRYFRNELNCDPQVAWLPDCFGFCYSLPQIMKECGMQGFVTTKLSWNQFSHFPHDTFLWQGVDGTRILCHFITTPDRRGWNDYSVDLDAVNVKSCWDNYREQQLNPEVLLSFGWGDGGGGPTAEMLENGRRLNQTAALPASYQGQVETFFDHLQKRIADPAVWNDELYLQLHRGTYTSQARIKKQHRECEVLLHTLEWLATIAFIRTGWYPDQELQQAWEQLLLNQFHDILPGSSIAEVYQDCDQVYEQVRHTGTVLLQQGLRRIRKHANTLAAKPIVLNSLSWQRSDILQIPMDKAKTAMPGNIDVGKIGQISHDGQTLLLFLSQVPAMGYRAFPLVGKASHASSATSLSIDLYHLENQFFNLTLNESGCITSILDKRGQREVLAEGRLANVFQVFEDRPMANEAWDIDIFYQDKLLELTELDSIEVVETGPLRGGVKLVRSFLSSRIVQYLFIHDSIARIDFVTEIDWQQHQTLLKVAFPVNIHASRATYEIPFASMERPTHWNTNWDRARFEVPAQKWADLSEGDYGVSLINDCKYGYDVKENVLRLTLIKSAIDPDPQADIGRHHFRYALYPHAGDWRVGGTVKMAYEFNHPLLADWPQAGESEWRHDEYSLVKTASENVIIETVKKAEERPAIVLRVYEAFNQRGLVELQFGEKLKSVHACNGLEEVQEAVDFSEHAFSFFIQPFQIRTFCIEF